MVVGASREVGNTLARLACLAVSDLALTGDFSHLASGISYLTS